jgi:AhpD family alkylhydroperoxidase
MSTERTEMADDVQVANRRLDASGNEALIGLARMGADAFGYKADLRIDRGLAELLRLRVSQLNNCTYCLNLHSEAARDAGITRAKIDTLTAWWETELHLRSDAVSRSGSLRCGGSKWWRSSNAWSVMSGNTRARRTAILR